MGALFGALTALAIGVSDVFGRRVTLASSALTAAGAMQAVAALTALLTIPLVSSEFLWADTSLGAVSGLGMGLGLACYFAGLSRSSSAVVAPLVATLSALVPYGYTLVTGTSPTGLGMVGALLALGGLWLITVSGASPERVKTGLLWGLASGLAYGFGLTVLIETTEESGSWPSFSQRVVAWLLLMALATSTGAARIPPAGVRVAATSAGVLAGLTSIFFIAGVQIDAQPTVVASSAFPAASVLGGWLVYDDEVSKAQVVGIAAVLIGVGGVVVS